MHIDANDADATDVAASDVSNSPADALVTPKTDAGDSLLYRTLTALIPLFAFVALLLTGIIRCPIKLATGVPCPGCGLTRGSLALMHLDFASMLHFHPLTPILTPLVLFVIGSATLSRIRPAPNAQDPLSRIPKGFWLVLLICFLGIWGLRLAGYLGGHPDGVHLHEGIFYRVLSTLFG